MEKEFEDISESYAQRNSPGMDLTQGAPQADSFLNSSQTPPASQLSASAPTAPNSSTPPPYMGFMNQSNLPTPAPQSTQPSSHPQSNYSSIPTATNQMMTQPQLPTTSPYPSYPGTAPQPNSFPSSTPPAVSSQSQYSSAPTPSYQNLSPSSGLHQTPQSSAMNLSTSSTGQYGAPPASVARTPITPSALTSRDEQAKKIADDVFARISQLFSEHRRFQEESENKILGEIMKLNVRVETLEKKLVEPLEEKFSNLETMISNLTRKTTKAMAAGPPMPASAMQQPQPMQPVYQQQQQHPEQHRPMTQSQPDYHQPSANPMPSQVPPTYIPPHSNQPSPFAPNYSSMPVQSAPPQSAPQYPSYQQPPSSSYYSQSVPMQSQGGGYPALAKPAAAPVPQQQYRPQPQPQPFKPNNKYKEIENMGFSSLQISQAVERLSLDGKEPECDAVVEFLLTGDTSSPAPAAAPAAQSQSAAKGGQGSFWPFS